MWEKKIMRSRDDNCLQIFEVLSGGERITLERGLFSYQGDWRYFGSKTL